MKLAILGGTGRTGLALVEQALAAGHTVTALARNPAKLALRHERLRVIQGDVTDAECVARVVAGADAVLSVLGPASNAPVFAISRGMAHVLAAMQRHAVRRLVVSAGAGVRDPQDAPGLVDRGMGVLLKLVARNVYADMRRTVDLVRASDRDWTVVRVPMLVDGPRTGRVQAGYVGKGMGMRITRADLAEFMLRAAEDGQYLRQAPAISN